MAESVRVDVWSDIACPFCYIGKRKFEAALADSGVPVELVYHSFQLAPEAPDEVSGSHAENLAVKMRVSVEEARAMEQRVVDSAAEVGIVVDYDRMKSANTHKAHQLLHYAMSQGRQVEMKERLMAGYFTDGRDVGRAEDLGDLAAQAGLDRADAIRAISSGEYSDDVDDDIRLAKTYGVRGVPFFVIGGKYAVSGAQESSVFADALRRVQAESNSA